MAVISTDDEAADVWRHDADKADGAADGDDAGDHEWDGEKEHSSHALHTESVASC